MENPLPKPVLYVEDEENDALFMQIAFKRAGIRHPLAVATDGERGLEYLTRDGDQPPPCLVLLDLNLPRMSGMELLEWIRQQPSLASLPVIIFTSSDQPKDQERAKLLGADDYIVKPADVNQIGEIIRSLLTRWCGPKEG